MKGFYEAMQQHTLRLTPPAGKPMPIVIPSYNGARKQANLTPLLAMLLHKLGFRWWFTASVTIRPGC
jgi:anthranilate phosphoribosyltransferase